METAVPALHLRYMDLQIHRYINAVIDAPLVFCIRTWKFRKIVVCTIPLKGRHVNENIFIGWVNGLLHWKLLKPGRRIEMLDFDKNKDRDEGDYVTYDPDDFAGFQINVSITPTVCCTGASWQ